MGLCEARERRAKGSVGGVAPHGDETADQKPAKRRQKDVDGAEILLGRRTGHGTALC